MTTMLGVRSMLAALVSIGLTCDTTATKPAGYVQQPNSGQPDAHPPSYTYKYAVPSSASGDRPQLSNAGQGHSESRTGDNTHGNYFVNFPDGEAQQSVQYIADDWGYHPVVRYFTHNEHSTVQSHFALGESAVSLLKANQQSEQPSTFKHNQITSNLVPIIPVLQLMHTHPQAPRTNQIESEEPHQLQYVGVIPQEYPNQPTSESTLLYPVADAKSAIVAANNAVQEEQHMKSALFDKKPSLVDGYDVIDINHSAESVAQNALFQVATEDEKQHDAASSAQRENVVQRQEQTVANGFSTPIVVDDIRSAPLAPVQPEISISPVERTRYAIESIPRATPKQINLHIFPDHTNDQILPGDSSVLTLTVEQSNREVLSQSIEDKTESSERATEIPCTNNETKFVAHTIGVDKQLSIKSLLLEREKYIGDGLESNSPASLHSNSAVELNEQIAYVTTERTTGSARHVEQSSSVEFERQIIVPYRSENHIEHTPQSTNDEHKLSLSNIVNEHIDKLSESGKIQDTTRITALSEDEFNQKRILAPAKLSTIDKRPYSLDHIADSKVPSGKITDKPIDTIVGKIIDHPVTDKSVYMQLHVPFVALQPVQQPAQFPHHLLPLSPNINYVPTYPQSTSSHPLYSNVNQPKTLFFNLAQPEQPLGQHQAPQFNLYPPTQTPSKQNGQLYKQKPFYLPPLQLLPVHLYRYYDDKITDMNSSDSTNLQPHPLTNSVPEFLPQSHQRLAQSHPRPVYGVPRHTPQWDNLNQKSAAAGYAHAFGYGAPAIGGPSPHYVYRDEYRGPPPPLPADNRVQSLKWLPPSHYGRQKEAEPPTNKWSVRAPADGVESESGELVASASVTSSAVLSLNALSEAQHQRKKSQALFSELNDLRLRNLNFGKSMRWEDGFKPPMVPSVQTDERGMPLGAQSDLALG